jgi:GNAT superfamily N-acetyltransferase
MIPLYHAVGPASETNTSMAIEASLCRARTSCECRTSWLGLPCRYRSAKSTHMPIARLARASDLPSLLALFDVSEVSAVAQPRERAESIWQETLAYPGVHVFVSDDRDRIAATCMLVIAPNLLRGGRRHGFLENVVTHPDLRRRGHGKAVVLAALEHAWAADCHHVLMQSGRADPGVHAFYKRQSFRSGLRVAYVAMLPTPPSE